MKYTLFAFGSYYPNGGWSDFRGQFDTIDECKKAFQELLPSLMFEQGYGNLAKPKKSCHGQIVDLQNMEVVEEILA